MQKSIKSLPLYLGYAALISQKDLDQGDTSQRLGVMATLLALMGRKGEEIQAGHKPLKEAFHSLYAGYGCYRRSPDPRHWGFNPLNLSRDQLSQLKQGLAACGYKKELFKVLLAQILRLGLHQNVKRVDNAGNFKFPDLPTPNELSVYLRGLLGWIAWPALLILDLSFFVDLALRKDSNWDADNMVAANLLYASHKCPTPWSKLAMKLYKKTNFAQRLWNYHANPQKNMCEPIYYLYEEAFAKLENYSFSGV